MNKIFCDICNKEIEEKASQIVVVEWDVFKDYYKTTAYTDVCVNCIKSIEENITKLKCK